jgi:hypothetical protein
MKNVLVAVVVATSFVVSIAAQGPPPAPQAQQPAAQGERPAPQGERPAATQLSKVTMSGCIQSPPPASPVAGAPSTLAASKFELANAKTVSGAPVGTTGTAATATRYRLEGEEKTIAPHLNHQVEITGTVSPAAPTGATAVPTLKVESLKMIAATCP